jgi:hypothetical protein
MTDRRATATPQKLDAILSTIQNLMGRIEDERMEDGPEKDRMREHAERLMRDYRIEESELIQADKDAGRAPISVPGVRRFPLCRAGSPFLSAYWRMAYYIADHCEVRITSDYERREDGSRWYIVVVVGYEGDTRYAEALYTEARTYFANRMEPTVDKGLSDDDNVYRLRSAGIERGRIGEMMGWGGEGTTGPGKVTRAYKRACVARDVAATMTGRSVSMKVFREQFAEQFPYTLFSRLIAARDASDRASGGSLVLASRKDAVNEEFYRLYPDLRPVKLAKTDKAPVKAAKEPKWTKADQARLDRQYSESAQLGRDAGRAAAAEVQIKGVGAQDRLEN